MAEKIVILLGLFGTVAFLVWLFARYHRTRSELLKLHLAARDRLIAQAGSLEALLAFARTAEGRGLLEPPSLASSQLPAGLRLIQAGIVCLGIALLRWGVALAGFQALRPEGTAQTTLFAGAGLGLVAAGILGRRLQARWTRDEPS
jgi:hypothetical protein